MTFYLSKLIWLFLQPTTLIALTLLVGVVGLLLGRRRFGSTLVAAGSLGYGAIVFLSAGQLLIAPLENRYAANPELPEKVDGILVLSGPIDRNMTIARNQISIRDGAERYIEFARLLREYKTAKAIVSGGNPSVVGNLAGQAEFSKQLLMPMGIDPDRVIFEADSRNTYENIVFSKKLLEPAQNSTWIVITSAYHMPRAKALLSAVGWDAIAYPVDFRTEGKTGRYFFTMDSGEAFAVADLAVKEWLGIVFNRLMGRTASLWP